MTHPGLCARLGTSSGQVCSSKSVVSGGAGVVATPLRVRSGTWKNGVDDVAHLIGPSSTARATTRPGADDKSAHSLRTS